MSSRPLRVAILGSGFGGTVHAPAFSAHPNFELVAIASPTNAQRVAQERGIPRAFSTLEAMLDGVECDLLSIASPPDTHHAASLLAFERGLHILCEKPFALNVAQAQEMTAAAERSGKIGALCHEFRFLPARQALRELVLNDHLGALRQIEITQLSHFLATDSMRPRSWWFERTRGGGITGAWLSHVVDMACWLAGREPERVIGLGRNAHPSRVDQAGTFDSTVEDGAFITLDFGTGLIARLTVDGTAAIDSCICAIHGAKLTALASGTSIFNEQMYTVNLEETAELELAGLKYAALSSASPILPSFMAMLDGFCERLAGRSSDVADFADGLRTQRILAAAGYGDDQHSA